MASKTIEHMYNTYINLYPFQARMQGGGGGGGGGVGVQ